MEKSSQDKFEENLREESRLRSEQKRKGLYKSALRGALRDLKPIVEKKVAEMKEDPLGRAVLSVVRERKNIRSVEDAVVMLTEKLVEEDLKGE